MLGSVEKKQKKKNVFGLFLKKGNVNEALSVSIEKVNGKVSTLQWLTFW